MIEFSSDSDMADEQARAVIFALTTFGYVDGSFDESEKEFIRDYIEQLAEWRVNTGDIPHESRASYAKRYERHFQRVFQSVDLYVEDLFSEAVANGENINQFVLSKLKVRCFEIFESFDEENREYLLEAIDRVIVADGVIHPAEAQFKRELLAYLQSEHTITEAEIKPVVGDTFQLNPLATMPPQMFDHPMLQKLEFHFSANPQVRMEQAGNDMLYMRRVLDEWELQRRRGQGRLRGYNTVAELDSEEFFLDEYVYVLPPKPWENIEVTVLGDLHGCYSCLKAALMQADFFRKVDAYRADPQRNPNPKLVFLGDYIDRGIYSFNGVLRAAMQLFLSYPEHVILLRGNHEYYLDSRGHIISGVLPAEAIGSMVSYLPMEQFRAYKQFFDLMPIMVLFGRTLLVHAGIPRDATLKEHWSDLSSLNHQKIRFEMMWSDPSDASEVPENLQSSNTRFSFGKLQFRRFLGMLGVNTLLRGHEKVEQGFVQNYNEDGLQLFTLFSAGGAENGDLPTTSNYRAVTPMAVTIQARHGGQSATPWIIDWEPYNRSDRNGFYRYPMELPLNP